jgi:diketogulonate reductase-like aldo/keto reductase
VRALGRLLDDGLVGRVGLSNVNRHQLDEALELTPVSAVQVALRCVVIASGPAHRTLANALGARHIMVVP